MRVLILTLVTCIAVVTLSACGQKGPLYLPMPDQSAKKSMS
ncbi:MAG: lipoprotein [Tatlockia sp.]|nr:lipoprotein [Tatlockia sp.]